MKKAVMVMMILVAMLIPMNVHAGSTRTAEATYKGKGKFITTDGNVWKYKRSGLITGVKYTLTFNTKGTANKKDDIIKKAVLTSSMDAVKKCSKRSTTSMKKCADMEDNIRTYCKINYSSSVKFIKGNDTNYKKYLSKRDGKRVIYVTWEDGVVTNSKKDGKSYYFKKPYNYIGYKGVKNIKKGSIIRSYFIWCDCCNQPDDIVDRFDVMIKR